MLTKPRLAEECSFGAYWVLADPVFKRRTKKRLQVLTSLSPMTKRRKMRLLASLTWPFSFPLRMTQPPMIPHCDGDMGVEWTCFMLYGLNSHIAKAFCRK